MKKKEGRGSSTSAYLLVEGARVRGDEELLSLLLSGVAKSKPQVSQSINRAAAAAAAAVRSLYFTAKISLSPPPSRRPHHIHITHHQRTTKHAT